MNSTTPQSMSDLPELPDSPAHIGALGLYYTAAEMREYGRLCRATAEQANGRRVTGLARLDGMEFFYCAQPNDGDEDDVYVPLRLSHSDGDKVYCEPAEQAGKVEGWPEHLMVRDTKLHDDMGGLGQRIFTTAGAGYEKVKYIRHDLAKPTQPAAPDHAPDCLSRRPLDTGQGYWHCDCGHDAREFADVPAATQQPVAWAAMDTRGQMIELFMTEEGANNWRDWEDDQDKSLKFAKAIPLFAAPVSPSREVEALVAPTEAGWYWHHDGEVWRMLFVFPRPGHRYLAVQDDAHPVTGKRHFRMAEKIGGRWVGPLETPTLAPVQEKAP